MKILYNFPSRERPTKFLSCLENITSMARHHDYEIICTADIDDPTMFNEGMRDTVARHYPKAKLFFGTSKNKIDAINKNIGLAESGWDVLITHSDDFYIQRPGFDLAIIEAYSDGFKGVLHFPDQKAREALITYPIMHREYYERDGYCYHPAFNSVYADNYQHYVAKARNQYKFINEDYLEHRNAIWGFGERDALLNRTEEPINYAKDRATYTHLISEFKT